MTYNIGPKLGDFIHGLVVPKYVWETTGEKATIYISNDGCNFTKGLAATYEDLLPLMSKQSYVDKFEIHNGQKVDYEVFRFRQHKDIFKDAWSKIYFSAILHIEEPPRDYKWLEADDLPTGEVIINRSIRSMSYATQENYKKLIGERPAAFVYFDQAQYDAFPLKHLARPIYCEKLENLAAIINSSRLFICNQSAPLAIASALNVKRIAELRKGPDAPHYLMETAYNDNLIVFYGD